MISDFSVKRRVAISMFVLIAVVFGILSLTKLGLDLMPDVTFPIVSVLTQYEGVAPEEIEKLVTKPLEEIIATAKGVNKVSSFTREGISVIMVEFEWGINLDFAAQDLRDKIALIEGFLPDDISDPTVIKIDLSQAMPLIMYNATGRENRYKLRKFIEDEVANKLERIDGVASIQVLGGLEKEIQILLNKQKLESNRISASQVLNAVRMSNLNNPGGRIISGQREYLIRTVGEFKDIKDIENIIVTYVNNVPVYISDIAKVVYSDKEVRSYSRSNSKPSVMLLASKQSGANTVIVASKIKDAMEKIKKTLPKDVELSILFDQSKIIKRILARTSENAIVGGILAILMMFLFLRAWRPTFIISLAIPISLITTFIAMYAVNYTFNILTLAGLALGVGMLVDNAVVVIENIFRNIEMGHDRRNAAMIGAREVGMAITASTFTTIAVFVPMIFSEGIAGRLIRSLALTISFSLLASLIVALTIVPMFSSVLFKRSSRSEESRFIKYLKSKYKILLFKSIKHKWKTLGIVFLLLVTSILLVPVIGGEFMPSTDRPFIQIEVSLPIGTPLDVTDNYIRKVEDYIQNIAGVKIVGTIVGLGEENKMDAAFGMTGTGVNQANVFVKLFDKKDRDLSSKEITNMIRDNIPSYPGAKIKFIDMDAGMMGGSNSPIVIELYGDELNILKKLSEKVISLMEDIDGVKDIKSSYEEQKPEMVFYIDRIKAGNLGYNIAQIGSEMETILKGKIATRFRYLGNEIDVRVKYDDKYTDKIDDILSLNLINAQQTSIQLKQLVNNKKELGPVKIDRKNRTRVITITANTYKKDLQSIMNIVKETINKNVSFPIGYSVEFTGSYEEMIDTFITLAQAFLLAALLVYMIMAAQFESFVYPFIIMFTIPLSIIGVVFGLLIAGKTFSLPSTVGIVILAGIVVNNAIVLVDFINQLKAKGLPLLLAVMKAGQTRLRPILITALTTIFGMLPMALSTSEGSEMRGPLAVSVMGGLLTATFLTLIVIPIIYIIIDNISIKFRKKLRKTVLDE